MIDYQEMRQFLDEIEWECNVIKVSKEQCILFFASLEMENGSKKYQVI